MSAIELDNGETYLAIEPNMVSPTEKIRDPARDARDYRVGGTLSRQALHQVDHTIIHMFSHHSNAFHSYFILILFHSYSILILFHSYSNAIPILVLFYFISILILFQTYFNPILFLFQSYTQTLCLDKVVSV